MKIILPEKMKTLNDWPKYKHKVASQISNDFASKLTLECQQGRRKSKKKERPVWDFT